MIQSTFIKNAFIRKRTSSLAILLVFQLYILLGCSPFRKGNELTKFETLEFSFQNPANSKFFSVLFSQSDTVFLKKYLHSDNDTVLYSILPDSARSIINTFVINISSSLLHPLKPDSIEDFNPGKARFSLYIDYSDENQWVDFHSLHPFIAFIKFNNWINKIIESLQFNFANTSINFKEDKKIHEAMDKGNSTH